MNRHGRSLTRPPLPSSSSSSSVVGGGGGVGMGVGLGKRGRSASPPPMRGSAIKEFLEGGETKDEEKKGEEKKEEEEKKGEEEKGEEEKGEEEKGEEKKGEEGEKKEEEKKEEEKKEEENEEEGKKEEEKKEEEKKEEEKKEEEGQDGLQTVSSPFTYSREEEGEEGGKGLPTSTSGPLGSGSRKIIPKKQGTPPSSSTPSPSPSPSAPTRSPPPSPAPSPSSAPPPRTPPPSPPLQSSSFSSSATHSGPLPSRTTPPVSPSSSPPSNLSSSSPESLNLSRFEGCEESIITVQSLVRRYLAKRELAKRKKNQKNRINIVREMVETEKTYVNTLNTIVHSFLLPLRALNSQQSKPIVLDEDVKTIFSSVEVILGFSSHLLKRLEDRMEEWENIPPGKQTMSDVFVEMASYSKVYVSYVSNYETASSLCSTLRKKNERFEKWEQEALGAVPGGHHSLTFLLICPVQRIPRYLMLVEQLLKSTWNNHQDVPQLTVALNSIREIAQIVDERTEEAERLQKITEIEDSIGGKFDTLRGANRRYVMEGDVTIISVGKQDKLTKVSRYFFLFNDMLLVCKYAKQGSLRGSLRRGTKKQILFEYRSRAWLATNEKLGVVTDIEHEVIQNSFELKLPHAKFWVSCSNKQNKDKWKDALAAIFKDLEPKMQFKQDVAHKMSSEKAKRARALIAQQYATLRVQGQRVESQSEMEELAEMQPMAGRRRFKRGRNSDLISIKEIEETAPTSENDGDETTQDDATEKDHDQSEQDQDDQDQINQDQQPPLQQSHSHPHPPSSVAVPLQSSHSTPQSQNSLLQPQQQQLQPQPPPPQQSPKDKERVRTRAKHSGKSPDRPSSDLQNKPERRVYHTIGSGDAKKLKEARSPSSEGFKLKFKKKKRSLLPEAKTDHPEEDDPATQKSPPSPLPSPNNSSPSSSSSSSSPPKVRAFRRLQDDTRAGMAALREAQAAQMQQQKGE